MCSVRSLSLQMFRFHGTSHLSSRGSLHFCYSKRSVPWICVLQWKANVGSDKLHTTHIRKPPIQHLSWVLRKPSTPKKVIENGNLRNPTNRVVNNNYTGICQRKAHRKSPHKHRNQRRLDTHLRNICTNTITKKQKIVEINKHVI